MNNWKTTLTGTLAALTSALTLLAALPAQLGDLSTIIPEQAKSTIITLGIVATVILRIIKAAHTQDAAPTAPASGGRGLSVPTVAFAALAGFASGAAFALLTACATDTGNPTKDRNARVTNAVLQSGADFLGRVAIATLSNAAQSAAGGQKIDLAHSAAAGLWSQSPSIVSSGDVQRVVNAWSGNQLDTVAAAAAAVYRQADPQTPDARKVVIDTLAHTLSESAFAATGQP